jgi:pimeloyl-ACP methyl ester carboxylesterase
MQLEIVTRRSPTPSSRPPLLFVHGAWSGAWMWEEHFLDWFAARGFDVFAPSLRHHGGSECAQPLRWIRVEDYVEDVARAAATIGRKPVIVGHSMGGLVVQRYLERHDALGTALLCSVPPTGITRCSLRVARHHPVAMLKVNLTLSLMPLVEDPVIAHHLCASPSTPMEEFLPYHARLRDESFRAFLDMLALGLPGKPTPRGPVAVFGAGDDFLFDEHDVRVTAAAYGVEARMVPGIGHTVMLEPAWERFAERLAAWLDEEWPARG